MLIVAVAVSFFAHLAIIWTLAALLLIGIVFIDGLLLRFLALPKVERDLPSRFASGIAQKVKLTIRNRTNRVMDLEIFDGIPQNSSAEGLPWKGKVEGQRWLQTDYDLTIPSRGNAEFDGVHVMVRSPFGLLQRKIKLPLTGETKVYPNYEPVVSYALLAMQYREDQMGIVRKNRVGASREFHQLRDYQKGDGLAQIDWKSTARHRKLISRDYQEQRNQVILLAIDSGRRLRTVDNGVEQFDHALNAMLFVAYLALKQGDQVGIMSFGQQSRFLAPVRGVGGMAVILNHLYNYETALHPTDFADAAEQILLRQRRRALVVMLTNLRGEDGEDLVAPLRRLRQKHLVLLTSLREKAIDDLEDEEIYTFDTALRYASSKIYLSERDLTMRNLNQHGIQTLDVRADELAVSLANRYYDIKSSGML